MGSVCFRGQLNLSGFNQKRCSVALVLTCILASCSENEQPVLFGFGEGRPIESVGEILLREYPVSAETSLYSALVEDFDQDGHADIFPHGHDPSEAIYYAAETNWIRGDMVFPSADRHGCTSADFDRDKVLDIFCSVGARRGQGVGDNQLFQGLGDRRYRLVEGHGAEDPSGRARYARSFNFNNDSYPDLFVSNWGGPRDDGGINESAVFLNLQGKGFERVQLDMTLGSAGSACLDVLDWNNDGLDDLMTCERARPGSLLLQNKGGVSFENVTAQLAVEKLDIGWSDGKFRDVDQDGRMDMLHVNNSNEILIFYNDGRDFPFSRLGARISVSPMLPPALERSDNYGVATAFDLFDADGDGDLDLYVGLNRPLTGGGFLGDVIFLGPDFGDYVQLPGRDSGTHDVEAYDRRTVVISRAGPAWAGDVSLVSSHPAAAIQEDGM